MLHTTEETTALKAEIEKLQAELERVRTENDALKAQLSLTTLVHADQAQPNHPWTVGDTFKSRGWLKTQFRISDRQSRKDEINAPDGSLWRRLGNKQSAEFAKRLLEKPNTIFYKCVG